MPQTPSHTTRDAAPQRCRRVSCHARRIAAEALKADLPPGWRRISDNLGNMYQYGRDGEKLAMHPADRDAQNRFYKLLKADEAAAAEAAKQQAAAGAGAGGGNDDSGTNDGKATPDKRRPAPLTHTKSSNQQLMSELGFSPRTGSTPMASPGDSFSEDDDDGSLDISLDQPTSSPLAPSGSSPAYMPSMGAGGLAGVLGGRRRPRARPKSSGATSGAPSYGLGGSGTLSSLVTGRRRSLVTKPKRPPVDVGFSDSDSDDLEGLLKKRISKLRPTRQLEKGGSTPKVGAPSEHCGRLQGLIS